jgi:3-phenylpropionate/cinnamic acid dioxygenase small subunit
MIELADRVELHELPGRYGDAIDDRNWDGLDAIFTADATFDLTDLGVRLLVGLPEIKRFMDVEAQHPRTHMMTNIYVDDTPEGVKMFFRIVAMRSGGLVGTASYYDDVVKTPQGWRVKNRVVTLRRHPVFALAETVGNTQPFVSG